MNITLSLSVEQVNAILTHLANGPYGQVVSLINEIQKQAVPQVQASAPAAVQ